MTSRLRQFKSDIAAAFSRLFTRVPEVPQRTHHYPCGHKTALILAHNFPQAREHARRNAMKDWVYVVSWEQLVGYRAERVQIVRLDGWDRVDRNSRFYDYLGRLEREIAWFADGKGAVT